MSDILASLGELEQADTYPGSKKVRKAVAAAPVDPWEEYPYVELNVRGVSTRLYMVGTLAELLERKPPTIRKWERLGYIPQSPYVSPARTHHGQKRLYTREAIEGIVKIAKEEGITGESNRNVSGTRFPERVSQLFEELRK